MSTVFTNGRFVLLESDGPNITEKFVDCMIVKDGIITYLGDETHAPKSEIDKATKQTDVKQRLVVPGFIDGHMHLLMLGQSLTKVDLSACKNLDDIRATIKAYAVANPNEPRIMCNHWLQSMTNNRAHKDMLDDIDPRPIFIDSNGLHSTWCNTAALQELDVKDMPNPPGGIIHRDESGEPIGLLEEAANINLVWPYLAKVASLDAKLEALRSAIKAYAAAGYTGLIEMAMDDSAWSALLELRKREPLPIRIAAYWLILPQPTEAEDLAQIDKAISMTRQYNATTSPDLRIVGAKFICDGTVDACTAALAETYATLLAPVPPFWPKEKLIPAVSRAANAGLQLALHAIGDLAVSNAVSVIRDFGGGPHRRHRIEHLELTTPEDAQALGKLGITASIQPVHADPAIVRAWPTLIGPHRCARAFAYREFHDHGAVLSIGSDSPTAPFSPLENMYVATTRKSARTYLADAKDLPAFNENFALSMGAALAGATRGSAWSVFDEGRVGSLRVGGKADFVVVDMVWERERLLEARVEETWFEGECVWKGPRAEKL